MPSIQLPDSLANVFFAHRWDTWRVWALATPATELPIAELCWHLELPIWSTIAGEARFDLKPNTVLMAPSAYPVHWVRVAQVDLRYPLELFEKAGRWVIVDGYHRLVRHHLEGNVTVPVRKHSDELWARVLAP